MPKVVKMEISQTRLPNDACPRQFKSISGELENGTFAKPYLMQDEYALIGYWNNAGIPRLAVPDKNRRSAEVYVIPTKGDKFTAPHSGFNG
jgi:hypothetical protein